MVFKEIDVCNENYYDVDLIKCFLSSFFFDSIFVEWLLLVDLQVEIGNVIFINVGVYYNYVIVFRFFLKIMFQFIL